MPYAFLRAMWFAMDSYSRKAFCENLIPNNWAARVCDTNAYVRRILDENTVDGKNPDTCMREASWVLGGRNLCTQHAGMAALEHSEKAK